MQASTPLSCRPTIDKLGAYVREDISASDRRKVEEHLAGCDRCTAIFAELGLLDLVQRMPGQFLQILGEMGWQLSHGERSRLYIARALLQNARLVVFDESFGALDPETLEACIRCVLKRAETLVVIAHP